MDKRVVKDIITVVVVLGVLFLIGMIIVGCSTKKVMDRSRAGALGDEGLFMVNVAKSAHQAVQLSDNIDSTSTICFGLDYLHNNGYYEKGSQEGYHGSVLISYSENGYEYVMWITNEKYYIGNQNSASYNVENVETYKKQHLNNINTCGSPKKKGIIYCSTNNCK